MNTMFYIIFNSPNIVTPPLFIKDKEVGVTKLNLNRLELLNLVGLKPIQTDPWRVRPNMARRPS